MSKSLTYDCSGETIQESQVITEVLPGHIIGEEMIVGDDHVKTYKYRAQVSSRIPALIYKCKVEDFHKYFPLLKSEIIEIHKRRVKLLNDLESRTILSKKERESKILSGLNGSRRSQS